MPCIRINSIAFEDKTAPSLLLTQAHAVITASAHAKSAWGFFIDDCSLGAKDKACPYHFADITSIKNAKIFWDYFRLRRELLEASTHCDCGAPGDYTAEFIPSGAGDGILIASLRCKACDKVNVMYDRECAAVVQDFIDHHFCLSSAGIVHRAISLYKNGNYEEIFP